MSFQVEVKRIGDELFVGDLVYHKRQLLKVVSKSQISKKDSSQTFKFRIIGRVRLKIEG